MFEKIMTICAKSQPLLENIFYSTKWFLPNIDNQYSKQWEKFFFNFRVEMLDSGQSFTKVIKK